MIHPSHPKASADLRTLVTAQTAAQQRVADFGRACAIMLGLDADDPALRLDVANGNFETPDPRAESPAAVLPSDDATAVP